MSNLEGDSGHLADIFDGNHLQFLVLGDDVVPHTVDDLAECRVEAVFHEEDRPQDGACEAERAHMLLDFPLGIKVRHARLAVGALDGGEHVVLDLSLGGLISKELASLDLYHLKRVSL